MRTYAGWVEYFEKNRNRLLSIPWMNHVPLTLKEKQTISDSIRTFQLGESSDGRHLMRAADTCEQQSPNAKKLGEAIRLFIGEEQRHAAYLARFMTQQQIPLLESQWTDTAFRKLRRFWNLEISVSVLLSAELVAKIYYKALLNATSSPVLIQICRQLLRDEAAHVLFHAKILGSARAKRSKLMTGIQNILYNLFHRCTLLVVWYEHKKVFHAGHYSFARYWKSSRLHLHQALKSISRVTARSSQVQSEFRITARAGDFDW